MALYWRKSTKILPGVRVNWSKSGPSLSVGPKGAKVNVGKRGTYVSGGIPGTGLYYRQKIGGSKRQPVNNTTPTGLYSDNSANNSNISFKGCFWVLSIIIVVGLLMTANYITAAIVIFILILLWYFTSHNANISSSPPTEEYTNQSDSTQSPCTNSNTLLNNDVQDYSSKDSIDVKVAIAEIEHLISEIDKSTDKIKMPSLYRKLMSTIAKIENVNDVHIKGLPIEAAKARILENYRKRMNT